MNKICKMYLFVSVYGNLNRLEFFWPYLSLKNPILTDYNQTALHFVVGQGYADVVKFMVENIEDHNPQWVSMGQVWGPGYDTKTTPLQMAASMGNLDCVKVLVGKSSLSDPRNTKRGETPLDLARRGNHFDVVQFLLNQLT